MDTDCHRQGGKINPHECSSRNCLHSNFAGESQLIEEVRLSPDLRNGLPHIMNARYVVVSSITRDRTSNQDRVKAHSLTSKDVSCTVIEVECFGRIDSQKLNCLPHACNWWFTHNWNAHIKFHVLLSCLASLFGNGAVCIEGLEAKYAFKHVFHTKLLQYYGGVDLIRVCEDVLGLRHALQEIAQDGIGSEEVIR